MCWKSMKPGVLCGSGPINGGCGRSCCVGRRIFWRLSWGIIASGRADGCGIASLWRFATVSATVTFGRRIRRCSRQKRIGAWAKRRVRQPIRNGGIIRFVSVWGAMSAKPCRFRNVIVGITGSPNGSLLCTISAYHLQGSHYHLSNLISKPFLLLPLNPIDS